MYEWQQLIQTVVNEMDEAIMRHDDQALTLQALAARLHYSEFHATRKFREMAGMPLRTYLHQRRLAFALKEVRDSRRPLLDIALDYGFSGQEGLQGPVRRDAGDIPAGAQAGGAAHQDTPFRPLYLWNGRNWHDKERTGRKDVFCDHTGAQVSACAEL